MNNQKGQSVIEYLLLFVVITLLAFTVFNSSVLNQYIGENGTILQNFKKKYEYSYRYALPQGPINTLPSPALHPSYLRSAGDTRFFGPKQPYP